VPLLSFQTIKCEALAESDDDRCNQQERSRSDNKQPAGADTLEKRKNYSRSDGKVNLLVHAWLLPNPDVVHSVNR
jgi:hypothetical protein